MQRSIYAGAKFRWLSRAAGLLVLLASLGFIAILASGHAQALVDFRPGLSGTALLAAAATVYGAAGFLLSTAWRYLLRWSGEQDVCWHESRRVYARTQLAKYVPGNVLQFVGRQVVGRQAGWSHLGLAVSSVFELISLLSISCILAILGLAMTGMKIGAVSLTSLFVFLAGVIGIVGIFLFIAPRLLNDRGPEASSRIAGCRISALWPTALLHTAFFLIGGGVLLLVCVVVLKTPINLEYWPAVISLFAIAWTAGSITPGAPSGLGVREAVLVMGLSPIAPVAQAILIAGLMRLVTIGGDLLFFLVASPKIPFRRHG